MHGAAPPFSHTSLWRGAYLSTVNTLPLLTLTRYYEKCICSKFRNTFQLYQ
jgi:hypothetical protein